MLIIELKKVSQSIFQLLMIQEDTITSEKQNYLFKIVMPNLSRAAKNNYDLELLEDSLLDVELGYYEYISNSWFNIKNIQLQERITKYYNDKETHYQMNKEIVRTAENISSELLFTDVNTQAELIEKNAIEFTDMLVAATLLYNFNLEKLHHSLKMKKPKLTIVE